MSEDKLWTLLDNGKDKIVNMLPAYKDKIDLDNYHSSRILDRIKKRYIDRGWKVMINGKELKAEHFHVNHGRYTKIIDWDSFN